MNENGGCCLTEDLLHTNLSKTLPLGESLHCYSNIEGGGPK